jgi:hypothetical protein
VGDHDDGLAVLADAAGCRNDRTSAPEARVEVAGGLVGEDTTAGRRDQRAGDRDPLLLAAGELGGSVREPVAEPDGPTTWSIHAGSGVGPPSFSGSTMFSSA